MQEWYDRQYSPLLNRDMEHALLGHDGKLCLAFAPQNGHTWDFRNFGMGEYADGFPKISHTRQYTKGNDDL